MTDKEKPMLIFTSCSACGACKMFRGPDGKPREDQPWSPEFIRDKLTANGKLKALRIINIHDGEFGPSISNIREFTLYHMIPSTVLVREDFFAGLLSDPNRYYGNSILRIKLSKTVSDTVKIEVEIDGVSTDERCDIIAKQVDEYFIWGFIPSEFSRLRNFFNRTSNEKIEDILPDIRDHPFHEILIKEYDKYYRNPEEFEEQMRMLFGFSWFITLFYPEKFRDLESFYPSWILILPSEWQKGITDQENIRESMEEKKPPLRKIYGKVVNCKTYLDGNRFRSMKSGVENINDCLKQYYEGRLFLTYEEALLNENNNVKKFAGKTYNMIN